jgi:hypothetical protein
VPRIDPGDRRLDHGNRRNARRFEPCPRHVFIMPGVMTPVNREGPLMFSRHFWAEAAERAAKTAAQAMILVVGADQLDALNADWESIVGFGLGGAFLSLCTSLVSLPLGPKGSASLVEEYVGKRRRRA